MPITIRLLLTMFFWGGTFIAGRMLGTSMHPLLASCGRFVLASIFLLGVLRVRGEALPRFTLKQWGGLTLAGLSGVYAYNLFFFAGLQHVEAGRAAMIIAGNPVIITLLAILLFGERFSLGKTVGIVLSLAGVLLVISRGDPRSLLQGGFGIGELYLVGCVASWATYALVGRALLTRISPLVAVTCSCVIGTILLLLTAALLWKIPVGGELFHTKNLLLLGYLAIFGTGLGFTWFYEGVQKLGAGRASLFVNLVPVNGVAMGALLLGELPDISLYFGGALVLCGLVLLNAREVRTLLRQIRPRSG